MKSDTVGSERRYPGQNPGHVSHRRNNQVVRALDAMANYANLKGLRGRT
ncbi:MAG: hypothetical protein IKJ89_07625 [Kiritimatiellae bacterium]|nr:hypothetical protein [Kiritimatiellia bacterium]